jgi:endonuclease/exonuclease/phosphatase family metal-dependent hydrolase
LVFRFSVFVVAASLSACIRWTPPAMSPASPAVCRSNELQWVGPDDERERARLDAWCAGVGGAAVRGTALNIAADAIAMSNITFVSWNVHVGRGDIRGFVRDLKSGAHTGGRAVDHYVLMLQEAVRTEGIPAFAAGASGAARIAAREAAGPIDIIRVSRELGASLVYVPSMRNGDADDPSEDRGNAILSTLPLSDPIAVELPGERQRRVVVVAKASPVWVAVVHLDALGGARRLRVLWTPWMRDVQVRATASALPDGPLVVGADLNTWHGRDEPAARFFRDLFRATPVSIDRQGLGLRVLDYMFFRAAAGQRAHYHQVAGRYGSDHRPLVGWVE